MAAIYVCMAENKEKKTFLHRPRDTKELQLNWKTLPSSHTHTHQDDDYCLILWLVGVNNNDDTEEKSVSIRT